MHSMNTKLLSAFFLCILLAACGGGDEVTCEEPKRMNAVGDCVEPTS